MVEQDDVAFRLLVVVDRPHEVKDLHEDVERNFFNIELCPGLVFGKS